MFQRLFESNGCVAVDFLGPLAEATAKWSTGAYPISKLIVETGNLRARALLSFYERAANIKRKFWPTHQEAHRLKIIDAERLSPNALPQPLVEA